MQIKGNTKHRRLCCSGMNRLLISEFGSSTQGERQFLKVFPNHTMPITPQRSTHLEVQSEFLNTMIEPQFLNTMVLTQLLNTMVGP